MRRLLIAVLLAVLPVMAAYSGTFVDDFNDGNLDGWHVRTAPLAPFPDSNLLKFEDGHLVIDPVFRGRKHSVYLELRTGNAEKWDSYTLTFRIRFERVPEQDATFYIQVRRTEVANFQQGDAILTPGNSQAVWMLLDRRQAIHVLTFRLEQPPLGWFTDVIIHRAKFPLERLEQPIADRWIPIKIVAKRQFFEFYFDNQLVGKYEDENAGPGTVVFYTQSTTIVHLDDIAITGPRIPFHGGPHRVASEARLATTWGENKKFVAKIISLLKHKEERS